VKHGLCSFAAFHGSISALLTMVLIAVKIGEVWCEDCVTVGPIGQSEFAAHPE
jgi:hypothetical protein